VHGRITDDAQRAAGRVTVALVRADGSTVAGVKPVEADDAGYYAFVIDPETAATIPPNERLSVAIQRGDASVVPSAGANFTLASGTVAVKDVALNDTELHKLQLRSDFSFGAAAPAGAARAAEAPAVSTAPAPKARSGKGRK